jgi:hypothetical protein
MGLDNSLKGSTNGPFVQFEPCDQDKCVYIDDEKKTCTFETCVFENIELPQTAPIWKFKCSVCDEITARDPRNMRIRICDSCLRRMLAAEKKPFSCVFCGASQNHNSKIFLSGICYKCFGLIYAAMNCGHCGRP